MYACGAAVRCTPASTQRVLQRGVRIGVSTKVCDFYFALLRQLDVVGFGSWVLFKGYRGGVVCGRLAENCQE